MKQDSILVIPRNGLGPFRYPVEDALAEWRFITDHPGEKEFDYVIVKNGVSLRAAGLLDAVLYMTRWLFTELLDRDVIVTICRPWSKDHEHYPGLNQIKLSARERYRHAKRFYRAARFKLTDRWSGNSVSIFSTGALFAVASPEQEHDLLYGDLDEDDAPKWKSGVETLGNWFQHRLKVRPKQGELAMVQEGEIRPDGPGGVQKAVRGNADFWLDLSPDRAAQVRPYMYDFLVRGEPYAPLLAWAREATHEHAIDAVVEALAANPGLWEQFNERQALCARKSDYFFPALPEEMLASVVKQAASK